MLAANNAARSPQPCRETIRATPPRNNTVGSTDQIRQPARGLSSSSSSSSLPFAALRVRSRKALFFPIPLRTQTTDEVCSSPMSFAGKIWWLPKECEIDPAFNPGLKGCYDHPVVVLSAKADEEGKVVILIVSWTSSTPLRFTICNSITNEKNKTHR